MDGTSRRRRRALTSLNDADPVGMAFLRLLLRDCGPGKAFHPPQRPKADPHSIHRVGSLTNVLTVVVQILLQGGWNFVVLWCIACLVVAWTLVGLVCYSIHLLAPCIYIPQVLIKEINILKSHSWYRTLQWLYQHVTLVHLYQGRQRHNNLHEDPPALQRLGQRLALQPQALRDWDTSWSEATIHHWVGLHYVYALRKQRMPLAIEEEQEDNSKDLHEQVHIEMNEAEDRVEIVKSPPVHPIEPAEDELPWIDVGAKIGIRFLQSEHVQRAISCQDTTERLTEWQRSLSASPKPVPQSPKPSHALWSARPQSSSSLQHPPTVTIPKDQPLPILEAGTKMAVPLLASSQSPVEMSTVVDCIPHDENGPMRVTVLLDRFYLRQGQFAKLHLVCDRYPLHSVAPLGACVWTTYGAGVLVGWRVEDQVHVIVQGTQQWYLQPSSILQTIATAPGLQVETSHGTGTVVSVTSPTEYWVQLLDDDDEQVVCLDTVLSCPKASFLPLIRHIQEAAHYQIQMDAYQASQQRSLSNNNDWMEWLDILWQSFLKAVDEDDEFDQGVNEFMAEIIEFLEGVDDEDVNEDEVDEPAQDLILQVEEVADDSEQGFWIANDLMGGIFTNSRDSEASMLSHESKEQELTKKYTRAFAVVNVLMRTVSIARASSGRHATFRLGLNVSYEFLLFVKTIIRVLRRNSSVHKLEVWKCAWEEIVATFGPIVNRIENVVRGIKARMDRQGRKAKVRLMQFVDSVLGDEKLLVAVEQGDWARCLSRLERSLLQAHVVEEKSISVYRKTASFLLEQLQESLDQDGEAASRNNEKLLWMAQSVQKLASPRRSLLRLLCQPDVLDFFGRILVRTYGDRPETVRMLTIHAVSFYSLRQLRILKNFAIAGGIWMPLLDAANAELESLVLDLPENSKEYLVPISKLFSLCVSQFHKINAGDLSTDWLEFLLEEDSVKLIQEIDIKLILALQSFSKDVQEMLTVLPYYRSLDDDILKLVDEVDLEQLLQEASEALDKSDDMTDFFREKATIAIERFLVRTWIHLSFQSLTPDRTICPSYLSLWRNESSAVTWPGGFSRVAEKMEVTWP